MIDKAPPGESGDVIRCDNEKTCVALDASAKDLEVCHSAVCDAADEFVRRVGKPSDARHEVKVPGHVYADLVDAVQEWKDAGETLIAAQRKHALAIRTALKSAEQTPSR